MDLKQRMSGAKWKNVLKNKVRLFEDKQNFFYFLGDKQNFKFEGV